MVSFSKAIAALVMLAALMLAATLVANRENTSKELVVTQDTTIQLRSRALQARTVGNNGPWRQVSVGDDGTTWALGYNFRYGRNFHIYRKDACGGTWNLMPGGIVQISVGNTDIVWGVNVDDQIFRWNPTVNQWAGPVASGFSHVSAASDGTVWAVRKRDGVAFTWNGGRFQQKNGNNLLQIECGSKGHVWGINRNALVFRWNGSGWQYGRGSNLKSISVSADGTVVGVNKLNKAFIWVSNNGPLNRSFWRSFTGLSGAIQQITVGSRSLFAGVDTSGVARLSEDTLCNTAPSKWDGPTTTLGVVGTGATNLPNGKVILWSADNKNASFRRAAQTWTAIYDPATGRVEEKLVQTNHDMFCPGTTVLADGRLMVTGGADSLETTFYNYNSNTWSVGPLMKINRGYHTMATLANGDVFTLGGSWSGILGPAHGVFGGKIGEIWLMQSGEWRILTGVDDEPMRTEDVEGVYRSDNHMWLFLAPNGNVFQAGPSKRMHWISTSGRGSVRQSILRGDDDHAMNGNCVMYDTGKLFMTGGAPNYDSGVGRASAYIVDINGAEATVKKTGSMASARTLANSVLLPSGEVVVIGGRTTLSGGLFTDSSSVFVAEIWSPITEQFKTLTSMEIPRNYHSTAILMKDGRVLAAGGGLCGGCVADHPDLEILTPPYLLNANGSPASRPSINLSQRITKAGQTITVQGSGSGGNSLTFALVRLSAVTHSVNNDQRRIPLTVIRKNGNQYSLRIPSNKNVSVVGTYYLFGMNAAGVPSVGVDINISV